MDWLNAALGGACTALGMLLKGWLDARRQEKADTAQAALQGRETTLHERQQAIAEDDAPHRRYLELQIAFDKHLETCARRETERHEVESELREELARCHENHALQGAELKLVSWELGRVRDEVQVLREQLTEEKNRAMRAEMTVVKRRVGLDE